MSASKSKPGYAIALGIEPMSVGDTYKHELHCTLVHWFFSESEVDQITDLLKPIFRDMEPLSLISGSVEDFGHKDELLVNLVDKSEPLKELHDAVRHALGSVGASYLIPKYIGEGWRPHVTHQGSKFLPEGETIVTKTAYLVEAPNGPEVPPIMVRTKFGFGSEDPA